MKCPAAYRPMPSANGYVLQDANGMVHRPATHGAPHAMMAPHPMMTLQVPQATHMVKGQVNGASTGSLHQGLGQSVSLTSLLTDVSDKGPSARAPPRSNQTAMGMGNKMQPYLAGVPTPQSMTRNPSGASMTRNPSGTSMTRDPSGTSVVSGQHPAMRGVHHAMDSGLGAVPREVPSQNPTWVIEEVIDFGPVHDEGLPEHEDSIGRMCEPHKADGSIFDSCMKTICVND